MYTSLSFDTRNTSPLTQPPQHNALGTREAMPLNTHM